MALPININDLIEQRVVESARIEYKSGWNPEPIVHTICAFANDIDNWGGGYVILGVGDDNGMPRLPVKGLKKDEIDEINKDLLQKCKTIKPDYLPVVEHTQYNEKDILIIWAPGGNDRPYKCPVTFRTDEKKKAESDYYVRKMSNTVRANENDVRELFHRSSDVPFDDRINRNVTVKELRPMLMTSYLRDVNSNLYEESKNMSIGVLAQSMHIVGGSSEDLRPLNVGLMFFSERPDDFFRYAQIEVVDKPDPTGDGMIEKIFTGPLDRQLRDALAFIKNYVIKEKIFKYPDRAESDRFFNYPYEAIEEILTNAVFHKSYQVPEPITVTFTPEGMEVTSCPGPDRSISDDDLKNCRLVAKHTRNRRIGDFLKELKLAERRNTGIPRILRAVEKNGSEKPVFETDADRSYLSVFIPIHRAFPDVAKPKWKEIVFGAPVSKLSRPYRNRSGLKKDILQALEKEDLSRNRLARTLGYTKITDAFRDAVSELMAEGKITYTIPDNLTNKDQKLKRA